jgi:hypothetical protein
MLASAIDPMLASAIDPMEGPIMTEGKSQWNERWYVLDPSRRELEYFTDRKREELRGVFALNKPFEIEDVPPRNSSKRQHRVDLVACYSASRLGRVMSIVPQSVGDTGKRTTLKISFPDSASKQKFLEYIGGEIWSDVMARKNTTTMKHLRGCLCGPFSKESSGDKRWQQRFFVLDPKAKTLAYFADETQGDLKRKEPLIELQVEDVPERGGTIKKPHRVNVLTQKMKLKMSLATEKEKQMLLEEFRRKFNVSIVPLFWFKPMPESASHQHGGLHGWVEYSEDTVTTGLLGHSWCTRLLVFDSSTLLLRRYTSGEERAPAVDSSADGSSNHKPEAQMVVREILEKADGRQNQALVGTGSTKKARRVDVIGADGSVWALALYRLNDKTLLLEQMRDAIAFASAAAEQATNCNGRESAPTTRLARAATLFQGMVHRERAGSGSGSQKVVELKVLVLKGCVQLGVYRGKRNRKRDMLFRGGGHPRRAGPRMF